MDEIGFYQDWWIDIVPSKNRRQEMLVSEGSQREKERERKRERERERGSKGWRRKRGNPPKYLGNGLLRPFLPLLSDPDPKWGKSLPCNSNFSDSRLGMKDIFVNFF